VLHRGIVTATGEGMEVIATADHDPAFATRHRDAPVWSVQYHPDFLEEHVPLVEDDWTGGESWEDCTAQRTITNFARLARGEAVGAAPEADDGAVASEGDGR
jgi:GMP synthase (glutamine-hydrolysing)